MVLTRSSRTPLCSALAVLLFLLSSTVSVYGYEYVTIINIFEREVATASKVVTRLSCREGGGFMATEATEVLHEAGLQVAINAGKGDGYYAYLGGGIVNTGTVGDAKWCFHSSYDPAALPNEPSSLDYPKCNFRWTEGRWSEFGLSTSSSTFDEPYTGVVFFHCNRVLTDNTNGCGPYGNFPLYFPNYMKAGSVFGAKPGLLYGFEVLWISNSSTATWSDSYATGGYSYYGSTTITAIYYPDNAAKTLDNFFAICQAQGPSRSSMEMENTSSDLQNRWWAIFFAILFVLCLISFIVAAVCQEREDMDEPPEDAPEWAQQEANSRLVSKSYISQRSFREQSEANESELSEADGKSQTYEDEMDGESRSRQ